MIKELEALGEVVLHASLRNLNTYKIGGTAKVLFSPHSITDLVEGLKVIKKNQEKYFILGNGSNIILNDREYNGVVIRLGNLCGIQINADMQMAYAEAGVMLPKLVKESVEASLTGLEFAYGIPGTIGGSIAGNAGAYNSCIMDYVTSVTVIDENLDIKTLELEEISYGYRTSMFKENKGYIIVGAKFFLKHGDRENSLLMMEERRVRRLEAQPLAYPSAGSVFRNPEGDFAGRLIEACGLKGYQLGGAEVSTKHANFIINKNNATSKDVYQLIHYVHDVVKEKTTVDLKVEQEFIDWE